MNSSVRNCSFFRRNIRINISFLFRDGFEVISKDGKVAVTLFSNQPEDLTVWYKAVKNNIIISARQMASQRN